MMNIVNVSRNFKISGFLFFIIFSAYTTTAQTAAFDDFTEKTQQSYLDRGYKLVTYRGDSITDVEPLVTTTIDFDFNTYYIVLIQLEGCVYCDYELNFVDSENFLLPIETESFIDNDIKQSTFKFQNSVNKTGKYVVFLNSDLPYFANIFVFKK